MEIKEEPVDSYENELPYDSFVAVPTNQETVVFKIEEIEMEQPNVKIEPSIDECSFTDFNRIIEDEKESLVRPISSQKGRCCFFSSQYLFVCYLSDFEITVNKVI